jgi:hypothetical protein
MELDSIFFFWLFCFLGLAGKGVWILVEQSNWPKLRVVSPSLFHFPQLKICFARIILLSMNIQLTSSSFEYYNPWMLSIFVLLKRFSSQFPKSYFFQLKSSEIYYFLIELSHDVINLSINFQCSFLQSDYKLKKECWEKSRPFKVIFCGLISL